MLTVRSIHFHVMLQEKKPVSIKQMLLNPSLKRVADSSFQRQCNGWKLYLTGTTLGKIGKIITVQEMCITKNYGKMAPKRNKFNSLLLQKLVLTYMNDINKSLNLIQKVVLISDIP